MTYDEILKGLEAFRRELAAEQRLAHAGLKARPAYGAIRDRHAELFGEETMQAVRNELERTYQSARRDQVERTLFALIEGMIAKAILGIDEELQAERAQLSAVEDGEEIGYFDFPGRIARENDFARRDRLRAGQAGLADRLTPKILEREHLVRQQMSAFGFGSAREAAEAKNRLRYDQLLAKILPILGETTGLYRRVMSDTIRQAYGAELGAIGSAHTLHWSAGQAYEHFFPAERLLASAGAALETLGLPLEGMPSIHVDTGVRPSKHPRASCWGIDVPGEVHLLIRPQGGMGDVRTFLHEAGHALHMAHADPSLPYEWRSLRRSHALTEIFSFTLDHLFENPLWLEHVMHLPKAVAERAAAWNLLGNLFMLRRYVAKFSYELAFDEKPYDVARNKALYANTLKELTGFSYEPDFFLEDMDGGFYSADYVRAWIAAAQLEEHLIRKLGDRWFLKRDTGAYLKSFFAKGESWQAEELVQQLGMAPWDTLPLIRRFDGVSRLLR